MHNILEKTRLPHIEKDDSSACLKSSYLLGLGMLYMMFPMVSGLLIYKIVAIGIFMAPAGIFINPIVYCLSNVTTEVYGYEIARNMMWWFIISSITFVILAATLIKLPSSPNFAHQGAYDLIFGSMPRVCLAGIIGTVVSLSFNNYFLSKLKIKLQGKAYWLRSILSTSPGEILYNLIAYPIMFLGTMPLENLVYIFLSVSCFKIGMTFFFTPAEWFLANYLKNKERINVFDYGVDYRIFRFKLSKNRPELKAV